MRKTINNFFTSKPVAYFIVPIGLLFFWFGASLMAYHKVSFTVLTYKQNSGDKIKAPVGKLYKGSKIEGNFKAQDNHLGILMLRFSNFVKPDYVGEDVLIFKLKESGKKEWYYVNSYRSGLLEHQLLFPFGFPIIDDSRGKSYQFEITSSFGTDRNAIQIDKSQPSIITAYQYPRNEILASKKRLIAFALTKIKTSVSDIDFVFSSIFYLVPFIIYVVLRFLKNKISVKKNVLSIIIVGLIVSEAFLLKEFYPGILVLLFFAWFFSIKIYRYDSSVSFLLAFFLTTLWLPVTAVQWRDVSSKMNIWVYMFLVMGVVQTFLENKYNFKKRVDYKMFINALLKRNEKV